MHDLVTIECRYNGPIPDDERWALRFGGRAAYERARANAMIRYLKERCARLVRTAIPTPALHDEVRRLLALQGRRAA